MRLEIGHRALAISALLSLAACLAQPAGAQDIATEEAEPAPPEADAAVIEEPVEAGEDYVEDSGGAGTDILSANTFTILAQGSLVLADGGTTFTEAGFGKTRFDGTSDGDLALDAMPTEAALIWQPRFTGTLSGNVSAMWQEDQENEVDLIEAYLTFVPRRSGNVNFAVKAGLYWPEISLEHATGGAWSTVYTVTPSAINSWVGEEVKVIGAEATLLLTLGEHDLSLTGGAFGFNDTSGTLLSFRGWALHDMKATAFGHFELPPLNPFMTRAQEDRTRSLLELDDRVGFYGRAEWRPSPFFAVNAFYYDNFGDPEVFNPSLQWGWRTRFLNLGLVADLPGEVRLIAQGMQGTTQMGFIPPGQTRYWVDTRYRSLFALLTRPLGAGAVSVRGEVFDTEERGSRMDPAEEDEDGWAATAALRWPLGDLLTLFVEGLHIESKRGARARLGLPPDENQTVLQAALRLRW